MVSLVCFWHLLNTLTLTHTHIHTHHALTLMHSVRFSIDWTQVSRKRNHRVFVLKESERANLVLRSFCVFVFLFSFSLLLCLAALGMFERVHISSVFVTLLCLSSVYVCFCMRSIVSKSLALSFFIAAWVSVCVVFTLCLLPLCKSHTYRLNRTARTLTFFFYFVPFAEHLQCSNVQVYIWPTSC